ncbi:MAG: PTS sugar transporter subunit IIA [bacterium]|nr:PTS sugar transporter subunit IIA [bacterium]
MNLSELFDDHSLLLDVEPYEKEKLLETILKEFDSRGKIKDFDRALADVIEREKVMSTGIGNGVAIPHAYTDGVSELVAGFFRTREPVDFTALDGKQVDLFFIILGPKASRRNHIKVLAKISRLLNHEEFRGNLRDAASITDVREVFKRHGDR